MNLLKNGAPPFGQAQKTYYLIMTDFREKSKSKRENNQISPEFFVPVGSAGSILEKRRSISPVTGWGKTNS